MAKLKGKVVRSDLEGGFWTLEADDGSTYKLEGGGADLLKAGVRAEIDGSLERGDGHRLRHAGALGQKVQDPVIGSAHS